MRKAIKQNTSVGSSERRFSKNPIDREIESLKAKNHEMREKIRRRGEYTSIDINVSSEIGDEGMYVRELELGNQKLQRENRVLAERLGSRLKG